MGFMDYGHWDYDREYEEQYDRDVSADYTHPSRYGPLYKKQMHDQECGGKMIVRTNSHTGDKFMGCRKFPKCRYTEPHPQGELLL